MLWTAFTMAFYGFFLVGELVNRRWIEVSLSPDRISITLCQSTLSDGAAQLRYLNPTPPLAHTMLWTITVK